MIKAGPATLHCMEAPQKALLDAAAKDAIAAAFAASDLGHIDEIFGLFLGYANVNYRVKTSKGNFLARFCRAQSQQRIHDEILFLGSIQKSGFPASYPIPRSDGEYVTHHQQEKVMIYDFIEGKPPQVNSDSAHQIGQALGCLSLKPIPPGYTSTALIDIEDLRSFRQEKMTELQQYPEFCDEFLEQTASIEASLPFDLPRGFVHADAFPDNTIFRDGKLMALIDFEDSCNDALIFDIGMAIIGFGYLGDTLDKNLVAALLAGYQSHRKLSVAEQQALPAMARWCAHGMGFWHLRCYLENPNQRQHQRIHELQQMVRGLRENDGDKILAAFHA